MQETQVLSLGWEDSLEKEMATHSSTLAWKIPQTEEPSRLQSMGLQRVGHNKATKHSTITVRALLFYTNIRITLSESEVKVFQSCLTLCDPMDCTVHGILQATVLEWVAFPFSRGSSQPRDKTRVSCIVGRFFTNKAIRENLV